MTDRKKDGARKGLALGLFATVPAAVLIMAVSAGGSWVKAFADDLANTRTTAADAKAEVERQRPIVALVPKLKNRVNKQNAAIARLEKSAGESSAKLDALKSDTDRIVGFLQPRAQAKPQPKVVAKAKPAPPAKIEDKVIDAIKKPFKWVLDADERAKR